MGSGISIEGFDLVIFNDWANGLKEKKMGIGEIIRTENGGKPVFLYYGRWHEALPRAQSISTASNFRSTLVPRILELLRMQEMQTSLSSS